MGRILCTGLGSPSADMDVERENPSPISQEDSRVGRRAAAPGTVSDGANGHPSGPGGSHDQCASHGAETLLFLPLA